ncbi:MAG: YHYH domain-containing protein [Oscillospiraceae bacterium]|nr:YHYH domain-containing protein [Oscillospiraceae bacterium]
MKYLKYFVALIITFTCSLSVLAHGGSVDAYGGHVDWESGEYHYHHGYSAHQHTNGVCPYDFADNADHSNHGSTSNNNHSYNYGDRDQYVPAVQYTLKPAPTPTPMPNQIAQYNQNDSSGVISNILGGAVLAFLIYGIVYSVYLLCAMLSELGLCPSSSTPLYEATRIDHIVCFTTAVAIVITFGETEDAFAVILCIFALYTFFALKKHRKNIKKMIAAQERLKQLKFEEEKEKYTQLYGKKNILDIINAPPTAFVDSNGLPHQLVKKDDIFVIYLAPKQPRVYHRHKNCGKNLQKDNFVNLKYYGRVITPCKKCCPPIPDSSWYDKYLEIKYIKEKYKID